MTNTIDQDLIDDAIAAGFVIFDDEIFVDTDTGEAHNAIKIKDKLAKFAQLQRERQASEQGEAIGKLRKSGDAYDLRVTPEFKLYPIGEYNLYLRPRKDSTATPQPQTIKAAIKKIRALIQTEKG